jgi:hypothetical protein
MTMRGRRGLAAICVIAVRSLLSITLALILASTAFAGQPPGHRETDEQPNYYTKPPSVSLEQAADNVRRQTGGRVLSATPVNKGGQRGYSVRVLLDGKRVKQVFVDSEGRIQ